MGTATSRFGAAALLGGAVTLAGCSSDAATVSPPVPTAPPAPTATIGLSVAITAIATAAPHPRPTPTATRFVPPAGPWIRVTPNQGPPASESITVIAGNLPARSPVTVSWSPGSRGAPLTLEVMTGPRGNLRTPFSVPAAPPGSYRVTIAAQGTVLGRAIYRVVSRADLVAAVEPNAQGDAVTIHGRRFLANTRLLLAAYPLFPGARPLVLGTTRSDGSGQFLLRVVTRKVVPGEYVVRAYAVGTLATQVAETFLEVTV